MQNIQNIEVGLLPNNNILRVYNHFPRRYRGTEDSVIQEMTRDLARIAVMGFNTVWINPLQLPGDYIKEYGDRGSLYAMADENELNPEFFPPGSTQQQREELLIAYVREAKRLGLLPLFDLALRHVGRDSYETSIGQNKNTLQKRYQAFLGQPPQRGWTDAVPFNYPNPENINQVMRALFFPFIEKYITRYGFMGARIDAVTSTDEDVLRAAFQHLERRCQAQYGTRAIIMGELMAKNPTPYIRKLHNVGFTHIFSAGPFYYNFHEYSYLQHWLAKQINDLKSITTTTNSGAGVVGFGGNHDTGTLKSICCLEAGKFGWQDFSYLKSIQHDHHPQLQRPIQEIAARMLDKLFCSVFICNGGWYLLTGDEYGVLHRPLVFTNYQEQQTVQNHWGGQEDLTQFITNINEILAQLPTTQLGDRTNLGILNLQRQSVRYAVRYSANRNENFFIALSGLRELSVDDLKNAQIPGIDDIPNQNFFILSDNGNILQQVEQPQFRP